MDLRVLIRSNSQLLGERNVFSGGKLPHSRNTMMTLPEQVLIKRRIQISDDGERLKIALKSLKQENSRLSDLVVLLSERAIRPFPRTISAAAATRELRKRGKSPLRQHLILAMRGRGTMLTKAIYCAVKESCDALKRPLPSNWHSDIRQILQAQCGSRPQYKGGADIFIYHKKGHWSCTAKSTSI
jgi:hypothetical protein